MKRSSRRPRRVAPRRPWWSRPPCRAAPTARQRGHARHLLAELVRLCRRSRATRLWLEVRESNAQARDAYRRLGFTPVGRRKGYYPAPEGRREDAVVMSLDVGDDERDPDALD